MAYLRLAFIQKFWTLILIDCITNSLHPFIVYGLHGLDKVAGVDMSSYPRMRDLIDSTMIDLGHFFKKPLTGGEYVDQSSIE